LKPTLKEKCKGVSRIYISTHITGARGGKSLAYERKVRLKKEKSITKKHQKQRKRIEDEK